MSQLFLFGISFSIPTFTLGRILSVSLLEEFDTVCFTALLSAEL